MKRTKLEKTEEKKSKNQEQKIIKSKEEWEKELTPDQCFILREKVTEPAFTGKYYDNKKKGVYACAGCGQELFVSNAKFESGTGWPSFFKPAKEGVIVEKKHYKMILPRTEVLCATCNGHLGHVFNDG